jgi:hypothetical protein
MRWDRARRSDQVEDRRGLGGGSGGRGPGGGMRFSLTGIVIVVILSFVMGKNPLEMLALLGDSGLSGGSAPAPERGQPADRSDPTIDFVSAILGDTEDTWSQIFSASGERYPPAKLVVFEGGVTTACGYASSAVGPFYCPGDKQVYLDLQFFPRTGAAFQRGRRFRPGLCDRARNRPSHPNPDRRVGQGQCRTATRPERSKAMAACWCDRNCKPTVTPESGRIRHGSVSTCWNPVIWKKP